MAAEDADFLPAGQGPVLEGLVMAARDERAAMRSEDHRRDPVGMSLERGRQLSAGNFP